MDAPKLRAWWFAKQGLDRRFVSESPREILHRTGWARSVGGANPYLTIFARSNHRQVRVDQDAALAEIHELPSARGCTYVLGADDFALGLSAGKGFSEEAAIKTAVRFLGVTEEEIAHLSEKVLQVLGNEDLDPKEIKTRVGDAARHLGEEGKKRGQTTTLPLALGRLQQAGLIRRIPVEGRLDRQRYLYRAWRDSPMASWSRNQEEIYADLARRYFQWIGPASAGNFQWFSGLSAKAVKAAIAPLGLVPAEPGGDLLILPDELDAWQHFLAPSQPLFALISALDGLMLLRRDTSMLLEDVDRERKAPGEKGVLRPVGHLMDLSNNAIVDRGRIVGLWEFDPQAGEILAVTFVPRTDEMEAEIRRTETFIREDLGDCRSFSLDSPESRKPVLEALRELAKTTV